MVYIGTLAVQLKLYKKGSLLVWENHISVLGKQGTSSFYPAHVYLNMVLPSLTHIDVTWTAGEFTLTPDFVGSNL